MMRRRRPLAALALIATAALVTACGSSTPTGGAGGGSAGKTSAAAKQAVRFAACMRSNGVNKFPDPNASGQLTIDAVANGSGLNTNTPAFTQALSACKTLEPAGFTGGRRSVGQQSSALRFAQCMRQNGVKDFPDPLNGQPLVDTNRIPSTAQPGGMSILKEAMQRCRGAAVAAGVHA